METACRQHRCGQNAMKMDRLVAACGCAPDSMTMEKLDIASAVGEELEAACHRRCRVLNATAMDKLDAACHHCGQKATTTGKL